jgi:hypothetical protein
MPDSDSLIRTLAFQRGLLSLLTGTEAFSSDIQRAIDEMDSLIESFVTLSIR